MTEPAITISARGTIGYTELRNEPFYPIIRVLVVIPDSNLVHLEYLVFAIQSLNLAGAGTSIPQMTVPTMKRHSVLLPPLQEQKLIAAKLYKQMKHTTELTESIEQELDVIKALPAAILRKAFAGEL